MTPEPTENGSYENRAAPRSAPDKFYSVEFALKGEESHYQFKIWNMSSDGMCILVREDSAVLRHIHTGEVLQMKYYAAEPRRIVESLKTEVRHITRDEQGRFKGHFMVGLSILEHN
ncbi:MAG: PilZ domain-containing protein [Thermodesulfobacteriota bacterium]